MHRLFIGLRPPPDIRDALRATMSGVPGARWQDDDQLHLTLRFIGEVDRPQAEDIASALDTIHAPPVALAVEGVGAFDTRGRVNTLWAGVRPHGPVTALHRKIDAALVRAGCAPDPRAFLPHITLARLNVPMERVAGFLADHAGLASPAFTLDHFLLFESHLGRERARYDAVARYSLAATA
ncbi:RNA 2',3'-cyclic phosphodiesterase [Sphingomonas sp.]|uniref:RNA 2',3'-cyclic phosphodiesterase n=1 Tax=Sphingomonas sp. TaxID=28214 RepID=UPI002BF39EDA|nr:RNA 2',3'-cyclic phosphodiesterase [Sphingomonas sp.]HWK35542.1 RNA 2',3'-cyclic phosphodiesterase [Sphingomonas sp.]